MEKKKEFKPLSSNQVWLIKLSRQFCVLGAGDIPWRGQISLEEQPWPRKIQHIIVSCWVSWLVLVPDTLTMILVESQAVDLLPGGHGSPQLHGVINLRSYWLLRLRIPCLSVCPCVCVCWLCSDSCTVTSFTFLPLSSIYVFYSSRLPFFFIFPSALSFIVSCFICRSFLIPFVLYCLFLPKSRGALLSYLPILSLTLYLQPLFSHFYL